MRSARFRARHDSDRQFELNVTWDWKSLTDLVGEEVEGRKAGKGLRLEERRRSRCRSKARKKAKGNVTILNTACMHALLLKLLLFS